MLDPLAQGSDRALTCEEQPQEDEHPKEQRRVTHQAAEGAQPFTLWLKKWWEESILRLAGQSRRKSQYVITPLHNES